MRYLIRLSLTTYSGLESADGGMYRDRDKKKTRKTEIVENGSLLWEARLYS